jgi:SPP1 gp7 family putative phage head morphogenesis protein
MKSKQTNKLRAGIITFPRVEAIKYEKYILSVIRKTKKDIRNALISFFQFNRDSYVDDLDLLFNDIRSQLLADETTLILNVVKYGRSILQFSRKQLVNSLKGLVSINVSDLPRTINTIDIFDTTQTSELLNSWVSTNVRLITSINSSLLDDVSNIIETSFRAGNSTPFISEEIATRFKVSDKKAKLIARDQTAKLHSNYIRQEHISLGITDYIWLTAGDERVRQSHKVLNNKICNWNNHDIYKDNKEDPWKDKSSIGGVELQVGEDFQCRCAIVALVST